MHFARSKDTVGKSDGHLYNFVAKLPRGMLHLDLEGVSNKLDSIKIDRFQYRSCVAHEAGSGVLHRHPSDEPDINGSTVGEQSAINRPILYTSPFGIAGANGYISPTRSTGFAQPDQIFGVMTEVGIHLKKVVIVCRLGHAPSKAIKVSGSKPQLPSTF